MSHTQEIGKRGEEIAKEYLLKHGYTILEKNWRHQKAEIDIICTKEKQLIIVEVKTRSSAYFGSPEDFVSTEQQSILFLAANVYMEKSALDLELRFDVISILIDHPQQFSLKHLKDAFYPGEF